MFDEHVSVTLDILVVANFIVLSSSQKCDISDTRRLDNRMKSLARVWYKVPWLNGSSSADLIRL
jgi:hypothetical protein